MVSWAHRITAAYLFFFFFDVRWIFPDGSSSAADVTSSPMLTEIYFNYSYVEAVNGHPKLPEVALARFPRGPTRKPREDRYPKAHLRMNAIQYDILYILSNRLSTKQMYEVWIEFQGLSRPLPISGISDCRSPEIPGRVNHRGAARRGVEKRWQKADSPESMCFSSRETVGSRETTSW